MSGIIREMSEVVQEYDPFAPQRLVNGKFTVSDLLGQGMMDPEPIYPDSSLNLEERALLCRTGLYYPCPDDDSSDLDDGVDMMDNISIRGRPLWRLLVGIYPLCQRCGYHHAHFPRRAGCPGRVQGWPTAESLPLHHVRIHPLELMDLDALMGPGGGRLPFFRASNARARPGHLRGRIPSRSGVLASSQSDAPGPFRQHAEDNGGAHESCRRMFHRTGRLSDLPNDDLYLRYVTH